MRIVTVTHFFSAHGGGIEMVAGHLCSQWRAFGHRVVWVASDGDTPPDGIEAMPLRSYNFIEQVTGLPMPIPSLAAMRKLWRTVCASDVVVIHDALYVTSILAMLAAGRTRKPTVLVQHIAEIAFPNSLLRGAFRLASALVTRPMLRAAGRVVFISATTRDFFATVATKAPPLLLYNGVDGNVFHPGKSTLDSSARSTFGIPEGRKLCLFAGRFVEKKGLSVLRELARSRPDLYFVLAGRGPIDPQSWGLSNVAVCRGLSQLSLAELYRAADVFLLPSVGEGYPLVIQEAMACGLPAICGEESARADPDSSRWLTGVPVSLDSPEETARLVGVAIDGLNASPEDRAAMAEYAARTYSWRNMAEKIIIAVEHTR